jgi:hypothetical protein
MLDHHIILFFVWEARSCRLNVIGEKLVDVINNDLFLSDHLLILSILYTSLLIRILSMSNAFNDLLNKQNFIVTFHSLIFGDEVLVTFPRSYLSQVVKFQEPLVIVSKVLGDQVGEL